MFIFTSFHTFLYIHITIQHLPTFLPPSLPSSHLPLTQHTASPAHTSQLAGTTLPSSLLPRQPASQPARYTAQCQCHSAVELPARLASPALLSRTRDAEQCFVWLVFGGAGLWFRYTYAWLASSWLRRGAGYWLHRRRRHGTIQLPTYPPTRHQDTPTHTTGFRSAERLRARSSNRSARTKTLPTHPRFPTSQRA